MKMTTMQGTALVSERAQRLGYEAKCRFWREVSTEMAALSALDCEDIVRLRVNERCSYDAISSELQQLHPGVNGLSSRTIRRFCSERNIHYSSRVTSEDLLAAVECNVAQV